MKRIFGILLIICLMLSGLTSCGGGEGAERPVDISENVQYSEEGDGVKLTGFTGNEENISIPSHVEGKPVEIITGDFCTDKTVKSVELPSSIDAFVKLDDKIALCKSNVENSVLLNAGNKAAVFCEFFNTSEITVNGVSYNSKGLPSVETLDLSGEWKNTDIIGGVKKTQTYTFSDGKVTCTADGDVFEGTYEIKNGELFVTLGDITVRFEPVGDMLISWQYNIKLSTKDELDYAETSDSGWSYILTAGGNAHLTAYNGNDEKVTIPMTVDGYEVTGIHSAVAESYDFTEISYSGHGGIGFKGYFGCLYYDALTDSYLLLADSDDNEDLSLIRLINMEEMVRPNFGDGSFGVSSERTTVFTAFTYCRFFKTPSIIIDGKEYASEYFAPVTEEDVVGLWHHSSDQYYDDMYISVYEGGSAELHYTDEDTDECTVCLRGRYTLEGRKLYITFENGTLTLDLMEKKAIVWNGNDWTSDAISYVTPLDFEKYKEEGLEHLIDPFLHISEYILIDTFKVSANTPEYDKDDYMTFNEDGSAVVTIASLGWTDKTVEYTFSGNTLELTDGELTEIFTAEQHWLTNSIGLYFYPSWVEE